MNKIKELYLGKPWMMYIAIAIILVGSALQIFVKIPTFLKIIVAVIVFLSFIFLGAALIIKEASKTEKIEKMSLGKVLIKLKALKTTEDIMTISYAAVIVLGTFVDSLLLMVVGIVLFVLHVLIPPLSTRYFKKNDK